VVALRKKTILEECTEQKRKIIIKTRTALSRRTVPLGRFDAKKTLRKPFRTGRKPQTRRRRRSRRRDVLILKRTCCTQHTRVPIENTSAGTGYVKRRRRRRRVVYVGGFFSRVRRYILVQYRSRPAGELTRRSERVCTLVGPEQEEGQETRKTTRAEAFCVHADGRARAAGRDRARRKQMISYCESALFVYIRV